MEKLLLDVGGTFIKCSDGRSVAINSAGTREEIISSLRQAVDGHKVIRAAIPGPSNYKEGIFLMKHKFAAVYGEQFSRLTGATDCRFIHDVNCMLLGEITGGNGRGYRNVAMVALGTGLGFSISVDGRILENEMGSPLVAIYNRPFKDGWLEDYASKRGVLKLYGEKGGQVTENLTVKDIAERAHEGEKAALEAFRTMGGIIGDTIAPIMKEYGTQCLLLGGQISRSADLFAPALKEKLDCAGISLEIKTISDFDNATFNGLMAL